MIGQIVEVIFKHSIFIHVSMLLETFYKIRQIVEILLMHTTFIHISMLLETFYEDRTNTICKGHTKEF